jgi:hypothetical protein
MDADTPPLFAALYEGQQRPGQVIFGQETLKRIHKDIKTAEDICRSEQHDPVTDSVRELYHLGMEDIIAQSYAAYTSLAAARQAHGVEDNDSNLFIKQARRIYQLVSACEISHNHLVFMAETYDGALWE